ncbi:MAG TPA: hypothetical protein VGM88_31020 [Kofleriaceae bacterium]|jgi:hypothetical protein
MTRALLLLAAGCLNVPAFSSDAAPDASDAPTTGMATVIVHSRDGAGTIVSGAPVHVETQGGAMTFDTASASNGIAQFPVDGATRVYVTTGTIVAVIDGVKPGDAIQIGAPYFVRSAASTISGGPMASMFASLSAATASTYLPCGHGMSAYVAAGGTTAMVDEAGCASLAVAPVLLLYKNSMGTLVGGESATWSPGSPAFVTLNDGRAATQFDIGVTVAPSSENLSAYAWSFGLGHRLAATQYTQKTDAAVQVPWIGIDDTLELSAYITGLSQLGTLVRQRIQPSASTTSLSLRTDHPSLPPPIVDAAATVAAPNTITWALVPGQGASATPQLVVVDVSTPLGDVIRWVSPASALATDPDGIHQTLAMPMPAALFPDQQWSTATGLGVVVRLVRAEQATAASDDAIYDVLRQEADPDSRYDDYANASGIVFAATTGVTTDIDGARYLP